LRAHDQKEYDKNIYRRHSAVHNITSCLNGLKYNTLTLKNQPIIGSDLFPPELTDQALHAAVNNDAYSVPSIKRGGSIFAHRKT
jgi:hypothetical protein